MKKRAVVRRRVSPFPNYDRFIPVFLIIAVWLFALAAISFSYYSEQVSNKVLLQPSQNECVFPNAQLLLRYDFNNVQSSFSIEDRSGNGWTGNGLGALTFPTENPATSRTGAYAKFVDIDRVTVLNSENFPFGSSNTICFWARYGQQPGGNVKYLLSKGFTLPDKEGISFSLSSQNVRFGSNSPSDALAPFVQNSWRFICGVYAPASTNKLSIYVNGVLSGASTSADISSTSELLLIGGRMQNGNFVTSMTYQGDLDDITIWEGVLTQSQIQNLMGYYNSGVQTCTCLPGECGSQAQQDTTPPTVSITSPISGASVSGTVMISASASDASGIAKVEFYRGSTKLGEDTTSPYTYSWDTTSSSGTQSLTAKAYDIYDNVATSSAVSVTVDNQQSPPPPTPPTGGGVCGISRELQLYYKFNNEVEQGVALDYSGNNRHGMWGGSGKLYSSSQKIPTGSSGHSAQFNGNNWIEVSNSVGASNFLTGGNQANTICFWARDESFVLNSSDSNRRRIVSKGLTNVPGLVGGNKGIELGMAQSTRRISFGTGGTGGIVSVAPSSNIPVPSDWNFICGAYRPGSSDKLKIYVNGVPNSTLVSDTNVGNSNEPLMIGASKTDGTVASSVFRYKGHVDEVTIWKDWLSDAEVMALYNYHLGTSGACTSLPGAISNPTAPPVVDTTSPNVVINYPSSSGNYLSAPTAFNFTATDAGGLSRCWWNVNGTNSSLVSCQSGSVVSVAVPSVGQGTFTWRVYANDTSGNVGSASVTFNVNSSAPACTQNWTQSFTQCNLNDTRVSYYVAGAGNTCTLPANQTLNCDYNNLGVIGNVGDIESNFDISVFIGGNEFNSSVSYSLSRDVEIRDVENNLIVSFEHNFGSANNKNPLNLKDVQIVRQSNQTGYGYLIVKGLVANKTFHVDRKTSSTRVCVENKDSIETISSISALCSQSGEYLVNCPGSLSGFSCSISEGNFVVTGLTNSAVREFTGNTTSGVCSPSWEAGIWGNCVNGQRTRTYYDAHSCGTTIGRPADETQSCTSTSSTPIICTPNWDCSDWSACSASRSQTRACNDLNSCGVSSGKPSETRTCTAGSSSPSFALIATIVLASLGVIALTVVIILFVKRNRRMRRQQELI